MSRLLLLYEGKVVTINEVLDTCVNEYESILFIGLERCRTEEVSLILSQPTCFPKPSSP